MVVWMGHSGRIVAVNLLRTSPAVLVWSRLGKHELVKWCTSKDSRDKMTALISPQAGESSEDQIMYLSKLFSWECSTIVSNSRLQTFDT